MKLSLVTILVPVLLTAVTITAAILSGDRICHRTIDLVFILDASDSIKDSDFRTEVTFAYHLAKTFNVGQNSGQTRIAVMTFARSSTIEYDLTEFNSINDLSAIGAINRTHDTSKTFLGKALAKMKTKILTADRGARTNSKQVLLIVSDGKPAEIPFTLKTVKKLKQQGAHIVSIAVGDKANRTLLEEIASQPRTQNFFFVKEFAGLTGLINNLKTYVCPTNNKCKNKNGGCEQVCSETDTGHECSCLTGYTLNNDKLTCTANSGCKRNNGGCEQVCSKTDTGHECSCRTGYTLKTDKRTCRGQCRKSVDLMFILDLSTSVTPAGFKNQTYFIGNLTAKLSLGQGDKQTRVGVITYATDVSVEIRLNEVKYLSQLTQKLSTLKYTEGDTHTFDALRVARLHGFKGARTTANKVAILLTDGQSQNPDKTQKQATLLKNKQVTVYAIGVGRRVTRALLEGIATSKKHVLKVTDYGQLSTTIKKLKKENC